MKMWLQVWGGHILLGLALVFAYLFFYFTVECMKSMNPTATIWLFICGAISFLLMVTVGILAAVLFRTKRQRYYIVHRDDVIDNLYKPSGGHG